MTEEPRGYEVTLPFLTVDLAKFRTALEQVVGNSETYFPQGLNRATCEITTEDATQALNGEATRALESLELVNAKTLAFNVSMRHVRITENMGLEIPTGAGLSVSLDFERKKMKFRIDTVGRTKAEGVFALICEAVRVANIDLPDHFRHLEGLITRLLGDHGDPASNVFLMMRFVNEDPFPEIVQTVKRVCSEFGLSVLRADDKEYTDDLLDNVLTYLYGCQYGIAIFDQINYREFNPNVALETGLMLARGKPVLMLKDKAIPQLPSDVAGKIYKPFNTYKPADTIPIHLEKWLRDYGIGMPLSSA